MQSVTAMRDFAVSTLREVYASRVQPKKTDAGNDLIKVAANSKPEASDVNDVSRQAQAKISEAMFSASNTNVTKLKMQIFDQVGEAFNVDRSNFKSIEAFGSALKEVLNKIKQDPRGSEVIKSIEERLGLDKLKISLEDVVNAAVDPNGEANERVEQALKAFAGSTVSNSSDSNQALKVRINDVGSYEVGR